MGLLKLEDYDTSKLLIDPKASDLLERTKHIPEFNIELSYRLSLKAIIRYVILMYDQDSFLWREVRSLPARKAAAMELAGGKKKNDGTFERPFEIIMEGGNQKVNAMIVKYISLQNSPNWMKLIAFEFIYHMEMGRVMNAAYKDAMPIIKSMDLLSKTINGLTDEIIGGSGEAPAILAAIYKEATKDLDCTPEKISTYIEEKGDLPDSWNPYAVWVKEEQKENYKPEKIRFVGDH